MEEVIKVAFFGTLGVLGALGFLISVSFVCLLILAGFCWIGIIFDSYCGSPDEWWGNLKRLKMRLKTKHSSRNT